MLDSLDILVTHGHELLDLAWLTARRIHVLVDDLVVQLHPDKLLLVWSQQELHHLPQDGMSGKYCLNIKCLVYA